MLMCVCNINTFVVLSTVKPLQNTTAPLASLSKLTIRKMRPLPESVICKLNRACEMTRIRQTGVLRVGNIRKDSYGVMLQ